MTRCPFCGRDPFHYVDIGVGYQAAAVDCCDLGDLYFRGARDPIKHDVVVDPETFREIGNKIMNMTQRVERLEEALVEAVEHWASGLNAMPSVHGRRKLDEVRALIGQ